MVVVCVHVSELLKMNNTCSFLYCKGSHSLRILILDLFIYFFGCSASDEAVLEN